MKKSWLVLIGLSLVSYYAYRELNRTKETILDSYDVPGVSDSQEFIV